jgi:hypothetical protein
MTRRTYPNKSLICPLNHQSIFKDQKNLNQLLLDFYDGKELPIIKAVFSAFTAAKYYQASS